MADKPIQVTFRFDKSLSEKQKKLAIECLKEAVKQVGGRIELPVEVPEQTEPKTGGLRKSTDMKAMEMLTDLRRKIAVYDAEHGTKVRAHLSGDIFSIIDELSDCDFPCTECGKPTDPICDECFCVNKGSML